jgi:hypothetical protein
MINEQVQQQQQQQQQQQEQQQQQNKQKQQRMEDMYGNEVKRRRTDSTGNHQKVWLVCEVRYGFDEEKEDNGLPYESHEIIYHVQEPVQVQVQVQDQEDQEDQDQEDQVQEDQDQEAQVQEVQVQEAQVPEVQVPEVQVQEAQVPPAHLIGRTLHVETQEGMFRGVLISLFVLNGERAIHVTGADGEHRIFTSSQIRTLQVIQEPVIQEEEEALSPIPRCNEEEVVVIEDNEVVLIEDDDEAQAQAQPEEAQQPQAQPEEEHDCCAICFDATDSARNFVSLNCGHQFHFACIMGNLANGGHNRNQCPMCRDDVVQDYNVTNENGYGSDEMEEFIRQSIERNQRLEDELQRTREYRAQIAVEYTRAMDMNLQVGLRHNQEQAARDALNRRAYACNLNQRIAAVVASGANNDIRQNYGAAVHLERQILDLCMSFGMMAYDAQYDEAQPPYDDEDNYADEDPMEVD